MEGKFCFSLNIRTAKWIRCIVGGKVLQTSRPRVVSLIDLISKSEISGKKKLF